MKQHGQELSAVDDMMKKLAGIEGSRSHRKRAEIKVRAPPSKCKLHLGCFT